MASGQATFYILYIFSKSGILRSWALMDITLGYIGWAAYIRLLNKAGREGWTRP